MQNPELFGGARKGRLFIALAAAPACSSGTVSPAGPAGRGKKRGESAVNGLA